MTTRPGPQTRSQILLDRQKTRRTCWPGTYGNSRSPLSATVMTPGRYSAVEAGSVCGRRLAATDHTEISRIATYRKPLPCAVQGMNDALTFTPATRHPPPSLPQPGAPACPVI
jgi:hypothetical protein